MEDLLQDKKRTSDNGSGQGVPGSDVAPKKPKVYKKTRKPQTRFTHLQVNASIRQLLNLSNNYLWSVLRNNDIAMEVNPAFWQARTLREAADMMTRYFYGKDYGYMNDLELIDVKERRELNESPDDYKLFREYAE
jgi:hypothetical protein